jgi:hypothetical protein
LLDARGFGNDHADFEQEAAQAISFSGRVNGAG